jgi:hypothetical protein
MTAILLILMFVNGNPVGTVQTVVTTDSCKSEIATVEDINVRLKENEQHIMFKTECLKKDE